MCGAMRSGRVMVSESRGLTAGGTGCFMTHFDGYSTVVIE